jgi:hypothetical protein
MVTRNSKYSLYRSPKTGARATQPVLASVERQAVLYLWQESGVADERRLGLHVVLRVFIGSCTGMDDFKSLLDLKLHRIRGYEWDDYYARMRPWLDDDDPQIRKQVVERLSTSVLWAEPSNSAQARRDGADGHFDPASRLAWLLAELETANDLHPDVIGNFLDDLRFRSGHGRSLELLLRWLQKLRDAPPAGVGADVIDGTILLQSTFDEDNARDVEHLVQRLDDNSDYVRACAARQLSAMQGDALDAVAMFDLIKRKELVRPGIAGAYWSEWYLLLEHVPVDPVVWMMDILEHRSGPEPRNLPFNGIDFYLHEICDHSPVTVMRMIKLGHHALAIETATETQAAVAGMDGPLQILAEHSDHAICHRAQAQLAMYYRFLHPRTARGTIRRWLDWAAGCEAFSFHWGSDKVLWMAVIYPARGREHFTNDEAWVLIDLAVPPGLRGDVDFHHMDFQKQPPPQPYAIGDRQCWRFSSGALVELQGEPQSRRWTRIQINGGQLGDRWTTFQMESSPID